MADDRGEIRQVNWAELFSFMHIFKGFRLAIHPSKLLLAFAAIALTWAAAQGLQYAWKLSATHGYVMPNEIMEHAKPGDRFQFVRCGYFCKDSGLENTFNSIVELKDSKGK